MSIIPKYFLEASKELLSKSDGIRAAFARHRPSAGSNREDLVSEFMKNYIPSLFGIGTGLIVSASGQFSNEADILVFDKQHNAPLFPAYGKNIWMAEAVYSLIEVKTYLGPSELKDCLSKCIRFKKLPREFADTPIGQVFGESLFVIWGFDCADPELFKKTYLDIVSDVPLAHRPDFVVVPGKALITSGTYYEIAKVGQPNSEWRRSLISSGNIAAHLGAGYEAMKSEHSLLIWLIWFSSWLAAAGPRRAILTNYMPQNYAWGDRI